MDASTMTKKNNATSVVRMSTASATDDDDKKASIATATKTSGTMVTPSPPTWLTEDNTDPQDDCKKAPAQPVDATIRVGKRGPFNSPLVGKFGQIVERVPTSQSGVPFAPGETRTGAPDMTSQPVTMDQGQTDKWTNASECTKSEHGSNANVNAGQKYDR